MGKEMKEAKRKITKGVNLNLARSISILNVNILNINVNTLNVNDLNVS